MTTDPRAEVEALTLHYITAIDCDHEAKTDTVRCNCSVWTGTPQPSVGAAVRQWADHVLAILARPAPPSEGLRERWIAAIGERYPVGDGTTLDPAVDEALCFAVDAFDAATLPPADPSADTGSKA